MVTGLSGRYISSYFFIAQVPRAPRMPDFGYPQISDYGAWMSVYGTPSTGCVAPRCRTVVTVLAVNRLQRRSIKQFASVRSRSNLERLVTPLYRLCQIGGALWVSRIAGKSWAPQ